MTRQRLRGDARRGHAADGRARYWLRRSAGHCVDCNAPGLDAGVARCAKCRERRKLWQERRRAFDDELAELEGAP